MAHPEHTVGLALLEEAIIVLFCEIDDAYRHLNPREGHYAPLKRLSDSEILTLALFQQLRGVESERSFLREAARFFSHLFPGVVGFPPVLVAPQGAQAEALPGALEAGGPAGAAGGTRDPGSGFNPGLGAASEVGRAVGGLGKPSAGAAWVRWGSFSIYGVKPHVLCATNRAPISYELTPANAAEVGLTAEL